MHTVRAALYCRVSTPGQRREATIETQVDALRRYCAGAGLEIVAEYRDDGLSGTIEFADRPAGARLLADARARVFDVVAVYDTSRLGRDDYAVITPITVSYLRSLGLEIHTPGGALEDTPEGNLQLGIHAALDAYYRADLARKSADGKRRAVKEGRWMGTNIAYGYRYDPETRGIAPDRTPIAGLGISPAEVAATVFRWVAEDGMTTRGIARRLNAMGIPAPWAHRVDHEIYWRDSTVARLFHQTTYLGTLRCHVRGELLEVPVEALVTLETWGRAQGRLRANRSREPEEGWRVYTLRTVLYCGECGSKYHSSGCAHGGREYRYYVCYGRMEGRCGARRVRADEAERVAWEDVLLIAGDPEVLAGRIAAQVEPARDDAAAMEETLAGLRGALAGKAGETDMILGLYRRGRIGPDALDRQLAQVDAEEADLRAQIADTEARLHQAARGTQALRSVATTLDGLRELLSPDAPPETQRAVITTVVQRVTVRQVGYHITYRF